MIAEDEQSALMYRLTRAYLTASDHAGQPIWPVVAWCGLTPVGVGSPSGSPISLALLTFDSLSSLADRAAARQPSLAPRPRPQARHAGRAAVPAGGSGKDRKDRLTLPPARA